MQWEEPKPKKKKEFHPTLPSISEEKILEIEDDISSLTHNPLPNLETWMLPSPTTKPTATLPLTTKQQNNCCNIL